jgi:hypothetical protein
MSVELDPVELGFRRPFTREVSQMLRLRNPHNDPVAFKVKTTAPKQYCVRPNSGRIEPGSEVEVQVLLQAMKEDLPLDAKCKDKFLVQSVLVTPDQEFSNVGAMWSHMEKTAKQSIQERKIRVFFLPPAGGVVSTPQGTKASTNGTPAGKDESPPPLYSAERGSSPVNAVGAVAKPESKPEGAKSLGEIREQATSTGKSGVGASIASAVPTSDDLKKQLDEAKAQIQRLTEQQGLRQRKPDGEKSTAQSIADLAPSNMQQAVPSAGVSVQIAAGLCLLSFLLAYFFF